MNLYQQFKTDQNLERTGVVLEYGKNSKGKTIGIRIARAGGSNVQYSKRLEAKVKPYRRQIQNETMDHAIEEQLIRELFAETVVIGWENVEDEKGKDLPFTVENCVKLFTDLPDLFADVREQAQKAALFREDILEVDSKN